MLFLLKAFLWFVTKPFRIFNKKLRSKFKESIYKPFKFLFKVLLIFVSFSTLIIVTVQVVSDVKPNGGDTVTVKRVDSEDEVLYPDNPNGTKNGLNLLLINNIKTEGYVKEYLNIAKMSEEGQLDDLAMHASVSSILGTQIAEGNTTFDGILPLTFLPVDSSGIPYWGTNPFGVNPSLFNLTNADYNFYTDGGGKVPTSDIPRSNSTGSYLGPFQQTAGYFGMYGGHYPTAKLNPNGKDSSRKSDPFYFPDQVVGLSAELSANYNKYHGLDLNASQMACLLSVRHNAGSGSLTHQILFGVHWNSGLLRGDIDEEGKSINLLFKDFETSYEKYRKPLTTLFGDHLWKFIGMIMLLEEDGWYIDPNRNYSYVTGSSNKRNIIQSYRILHPEVTDDSEAYDKVMALIKNKTKTFEAPDSSIYGRSSGPAAHGGITPIVYKVRQETSTNYKNSGSNGAPIVHEIPIETVGHMFSTTYAGDYMYAVMLKYAGVDVDPTNPDTYMNNIPEGEWTPSGDTAWMSEYGIDPKQIGEKRTKLLNEAYKWLGSWYVWGGMQAPEKDSNGNWIDGNNGSGKGFDCSRYTQYCTQEALGIDISRTTYTQIVNSNLTTIDQSEAKPGDLVYYYKNSPSDTHHVAIFLKNNGDGTDVIMHAPQTGDVIKIANRYNTPSRTVYRRINGIDN